MKKFMQKLIKSIGNKEQIENLLEEHKEEKDLVNSTDAHGDTLLHFAARIHCIPVMEILIERGADPEAVNEHGRRAIHEVIDSFECVSFLVERYHVDVNAMKRGDWTPVMIAALKGDMSTVKYLVQAGALLNRCTKDGRSPLYLAVQEGHIELSKYLTDQYPQAITQATKSGRFPIQAAAALQQPDSNDDEKESAAYNITTYLLSRVTLPVSTVLLHRDNSGRNILLDSAVSQNLMLMKLLLDQYKADPNDTDSLGRNMIHHAAMMNHLNVLETLKRIHSSLDWDKPDTWDTWTPLMHAARQGHAGIVEYLVKTAGVNIDCKDKHERTASDLAYLWKHNDIVEYLNNKQQQ